jgi:hypothetical protein
MTATIFPKAESLLNKTEYQKALNYVSQRKNTDRYRSRLDFLLCEIFTHFRGPCFKYYEGKGPALKDRGLDDARLKEIEDKLIRSLETAKLWMEEARKATWNKFVEDV